MSLNSVGYEKQLKNNCTECYVTFRRVSMDGCNFERRTNFGKSTQCISVRWISDQSWRCVE